MEQNDFIRELDSCQKLLIGLGEEWKLKKNGPSGEAVPEEKERLRQAYEALYDRIRGKDYFIVTLAVDAAIYETSLGSRQERAVSADVRQEDFFCQEIEEKLADTAPEVLAKMDEVFPVKDTRPEPPSDSRWERIVAPCGNETWRQCSRACTKDIWEPGEIPDDRCPHCGAPLTGNTRAAETYIEEGYLPQWNRYHQWLAGSLNRPTLILELGVGFGEPGVIRFPFEKTLFFNQKARLIRVNGRFPQIPEEIHDRAWGIRENSVDWIRRQGGIQLRPDKTKD